MPLPSRRPVVTRARLETLAAAVLLAGLIALTLTAASAAHSCTGHKRCHKRTILDERLNMPWCHTWACLGRNTWFKRWKHTPAAWQWWVRAVEGCESGHDPRAYNASSGAAGALQFMPGTWRAAGGSGDPRSASLFEQRVRAWRFASVHGRGHWVCSA